MEEIRTDMLKIFDTMMDKFPAIGIRYEFAKEYGCFLVSIDVADLNSEELDSFSVIYLSSVKLLQDKFGDDAPLFCMNEEWFSLSKDAFSYCISKEEEFGGDFEWINDVLPESKVEIKSSTCQNECKVISLSNLLLAA